MWQRRAPRVSPHQFLKLTNGKGRLFNQASNALQIHPKQILQHLHQTQKEIFPTMPQVEIKQISGTANQPTWQAKVQMQLGKKMIRERSIGQGKKKEIEKEACMRMIHELQNVTQVDIIRLATQTMTPPAASETPKKSSSSQPASQDISLKKMRQNIVKALQQDVCQGQKMFEDYLAGKHDVTLDLVTVVFIYALKHGTISRFLACFNSGPLKMTHQLWKQLLHTCILTIDMKDVEKTQGMLSVLYSSLQADCWDILKIGDLKKEHVQHFQKMSFLTTTDFIASFQSRDNWQMGLISDTFATNEPYVVVKVQPTGHFFDEDITQINDVFLIRAANGNTYCGEVTSRTLSYHKELMELKIRLPVTAEVSKSDRIEFQKLSFGVDYARKIDALEKSITDKNLAEFCFSPLEKSKMSLFTVDKSSQKVAQEKALEIMTNASKNFARLNESQKAACLEAWQKRLTLIQGPPGTGKTSTAIEIIRGWIYANPNATILVSAGTNVAADLLTEKLWTQGMRGVVRVGWDTNLDENLPFVLKGVAARDMVNHLNCAKLIVSTTVGSCSELLAKKIFDHVLIDEATQIMEPSALCALTQLSSSAQVILIGDQMQLPPTIVHQRASREGLEISLFERWLNAGVSPTFLDTQYRMHPALSAFSSSNFYNGRLKDGITAEDRILPFQTDVWKDPNFPISFINVEGVEETVFQSHQNMDEVTTVRALVQHLGQIESKKPLKIGVITPYQAQIRQLKHLARSSESGNSVVVNTVDGFQGSECDIVVFSAVRSNSRKSVGFLSDFRRLNVMLTRPKLGLVVIGNRSTLKHDNLWRKWFSFYDQGLKHRS